MVSVGSSISAVPLRVRTVAWRADCSVRRLGASPLRRPGRRRLGVHATPPSATGSVSVPRSVPNRRVSTATGTVTAPSFGLAAVPSRLAVTVAALSARLTSAAKRARG